MKREYNSNNIPDNCIFYTPLTNGDLTDLVSGSVYYLIDILIVCRSNVRARHCCTHRADGGVAVVIRYGTMGRRMGTMRLTENVVILKS